MATLNLTPSHLSGLADKLVGVNKELIGQLFGREQLKKSGQLQQEKGTAKLEALQAEVKADTQNAKAKVIDKAQKKVDDA
jgi:uncharacterized protein YjbJ (UPF0337 family)